MYQGFQQATKLYVNFHLKQEFLRKEKTKHWDKLRFNKLFSNCLV